MGNKNIYEQTRFDKFLKKQIKVRIIPKPVSDEEYEKMLLEGSDKA